METIIILLTVNTVILIAGFIITTRINKSKQVEWIKIMVDKISLDNVNLSDCFSEDVVALYLDVLSETNKYSLAGCVLGKSNNPIMVWASNDMYSRRFYTHDKGKDKDVEEMNKKLTYYDKVLLDRIVTSFKTRQDKLVTKFFI